MKFPDRCPIESSAAVAAGVVYIGSQNGKLYAVDAESGHEQWQFPTGDEVVSSPAVGGCIVYIGSDDNNLYAVDTESGEQHWQFEAGEDIGASPAVTDGVVYAGSLNDHLYAADAVSGGSDGDSRRKVVYSAPRLSLEALSILDSAISTGSAAPDSRTRLLSKWPSALWVY